MLLAAQMNGLGGINKPWHVKASYQTFDADGSPKDQGVFEEWWAGPRKAKISFAGKEFSQVEYYDGTKDLVTGDKGWVPLPQEMVMDYLVHPLPWSGRNQKESFSAKDMKFGAVSLKCVQPRQLPSAPPARIGDFCFSPNSLALRLERFNGGLYIIFNKLVLAAGHDIAEQVAVQNLRLRIVNFTVTALEFPAKFDDAIFALLGAVAPAPPPRINSGVIAGNKIGGENPEYPAIAKLQHVQGMVMLEGTISKTGDIADLQIISGPKILQQAAFDAVKTWKYKPYLLNGKPVEVRTGINVIYRLGG